MSDTTLKNAEDRECDGCALISDRRSFVKAAGVMALAALVEIGVPAGLAAAAHATTIDALRNVGANPSYPIPAKDGVQIDKKNEVILVRWKEAVYAFNLSCPHQNSALKWNDSDAEFQCPKHHSKYKPDGTFISGRATRNMDRFTVARDGAQIVVNVSAMHKNDVDMAGWSSCVIVLPKGA